MRSVASSGCARADFRRSPRAVPVAACAFSGPLAGVCPGQPAPLRQRGDWRAPSVATANRACARAHRYRPESSKLAHHPPVVGQCRFCGGWGGCPGGETIRGCPRGCAPTMALMRRCGPPGQTPARGPEPGHPPRPPGPYCRAKPSSATVFHVKPKTGQHTGSRKLKPIPAHEKKASHVRHR